MKVPVGPDCSPCEANPIGSALISCEQIVGVQSKDLQSIALERRKALKHRGVEQYCQAASEAMKRRPVEPWT